MAKFKEIFIDTLKTPFCFNVKLYYADTGIWKIDFVEKNVEKRLFKHKFSYITELINDYFHGKKVFFDVPILWDGLTDFTKKVLLECRNIPYGNVISYKQLAMKVGVEKSYRAVANALGKNKLPIIIPCHRVIGSDGSLRGFTGGLSVKKSLLQLEKAI